MKKILSFILIIFSCLFVLGGCSGDKVYYHAKLNDNAVDIIREDFAAEHVFQTEKTEETVEKDGKTTTYYYIKTIPSNYTFIVSDAATYDEIFIENELYEDIDFDKEILVVYSYKSTYVSDYFLTKVVVQSGVLKVVAKRYHKRLTGDACQPYQRWVVIRLDKVDFSSFDYKLGEIDVW